MTRTDAPGGAGKRCGTSDWVSRRQFLGAVGASAGVAGLAGCLGEVSEAAKRSFAENPVADGVAERPRLGPPREETPITIVSFDDPSCPSCASLHGGAFQQIESEWIANDRATMYSRAYYFVEDWSRPAVNALLETYRQDPATHWALKARYYERQDELTADNVVEQTASFLEAIGTTGDGAVDPDAVTRAARERTHSDVIDADVEAGEAAGLNGVPTVFLFEGGEFVTTLGDDSFEAYESAVESHA